MSRLIGGRHRAACSPLVVIIVILRVVVLAWVNTRLHGELLQIGEAEKERNYSALLLERQQSSNKQVRGGGLGGGVSVAWLWPCEIGGAEVALPQVSEEMASAAAVAAKDCYRGEDEAMGGGRSARRDTKTGKSQIYSRKICGFFCMPLIYNRGGGRGRRGKI